MGVNRITEPVFGVPMEEVLVIDRIQEELEKTPKDITLLDYLFQMVENIRPHFEEDPYGVYPLQREDVTPMDGRSGKEAQSAERYARRLVDQVLSVSFRLAEQTGSEKAYELYRQALLYKAHYDFDSYAVYIELNRAPKDKFYIPRREQLKRAVRAMQGLHEGKKRLLTISMPPGAGKTTLGTFYLSWEMGLHPEKACLSSGHSSVMTDSIHKSVLSLITDPEYLWKDVFPRVPVAKVSQKQSTIDLGHEKRFPTLTCRSIDGSLTGATRCHNVLYIDDLVEGREEALSIQRLDKLWGKYTDDLKSRTSGDEVKEIHVATRWSVHDPIGRIQRQYEGKPFAEFIVMPAVDEKGNSNFDYKYGVGFTSRYYQDMKASLDDVSWRCLYMNEPIEREGLLYDRQELNRYLELPEGEPEQTVAVLDPAQGGGDDLVLLVASNYGGKDWYVIDCVISDKDPLITDPLVTSCLLRNQVHKCQIESNAAGSRVADKIQELVRAGGGKTVIFKKHSQTNKETRIIVNSAFVKTHLYFNDERHIPKGSIYDLMLNKLCSYSMAVSHKKIHDDVPDGMAMLSEFIDSFTRYQPVVLERFF